jgi:hypothetical protein
MTSSLTYFKTAERPDIAMWIVDDDGDLVDFSTGYTFTWKLGDPGSAATFTKTTLITGAAGSGTEISGTPNIMLQFAAAELDAVTADNYTWQLTATTSSLSRVYQGRITIRDVIT